MCLILLLTESLCSVFAFACLLAINPPKVRRQSDHHNHQSLKTWMLRLHQRLDSMAVFMLQLSTILSLSGRQIQDNSRQVLSGEKATSVNVMLHCSPTDQRTLNLTVLRGRPSPAFRKAQGETEGTPLYEGTKRQVVEVGWGEAIMQGIQMTGMFSSTMWSVSLRSLNILA